MIKSVVAKEIVISCEGEEVMRLFVDNISVTWLKDMRFAKPKGSPPGTGDVNLSNDLFDKRVILDIQGYER